MITLESYNHTKLEILDFWKYSNDELECIKLPKDSYLNEIFHSNHLRRKSLYTITGEKSNSLCKFLAKSLSANTKTNILYFSYNEFKNLNKSIQNTGKLYIVNTDGGVTVSNVSSIVKSLNIDVVIIEIDNEFPEVIRVIRKIAIDNNITVIIQKQKTSSLNILYSSDVVLSIEDLNESFCKSKIVKCRDGADMMKPVLKSSLTATDKQFIG